MKRLVVAAVALIVLAGCTPKLFTSPGDGRIVPAGSLTVSGEIPAEYTAGGTLTVNGATVPVNADRTWSTAIGVAGPAGSVSVVEAIYTEPNGTAHRQRTAVVVGPELVTGQYSSNGVGMRFTNTALTNLGPVINGLAGSSFDISSLILAQSPLIPPTDAGAGTTITGDAYEAGAGGVNLTVGSTATGVKVNVAVTDLYLGLDLQLNGLISGPCKLEVLVPSTTIDATFDLAPAAGSPSNVDVNLVGAPVVTTNNVSYEFISGVCDPSTVLLGSIINSLAGDSIEGTIKDGFATQLADPDGAGALDSPIADAIETALAEISIAGSVGDAVQAHLDAPFTTITETASGIDFRSDADFSSVIGAGPGECAQVPDAPFINSTFDTPGVYPSLGGTTPSGQPYGLGLVISASAFNQLLGVMTTCGLLNQTITEIDFGGNMLPINSSILAGLIPAFASALPPGTPMQIEVDPFYGPFLDGDPGPSGEMAELTLADLHLKFVEPKASGNVTWLTLGVDAPLGFEMGYDEVAGALAPVISPPPAGTVAVRVLDNKVGANEPSVETLFAALFPNFVSGLSDSFAAFPLPAFLGLQLDVAEFSRQGNTFVLYADLNPAPQTRLANVAVTDTSTADYNKDASVFDSWEWRHRVRKQISPTSVNVQLKGMMGADACCTVDDERDSATASGRVEFDVIPAAGDTWRVDLSHLIQGAHTLKEEGYRAQTKIGTVTGRYRVGSGAWVNFNFNPSIMDTGDRDGDYHGPFTGAAATALTGTTQEHVTVEFSFWVEAFSNSNLAFPASAGNEAAVRFGANDSLTNNFTAGDYPGLGNRDIAADGYRLNVALSTVG
ncbi:MAG TPA: hypothetical protein PK748_02480 [Acidimicrobiales bacterium]|jgi:hypothetical protein|nr:hypothetical protein [Acidimicrobiales bacterium]HRA33763.1 hypothetical protein [Acidimicrobiales bacterium]